MAPQQELLPTPESIAKYVKQNARKQSSSMKSMMHGKGGQEVIRQDDYKGHHIVVKTKYDMTIDGQVVTGHIMLTNLGQVQYHGLPNHSFDSAVELARALIDNFPEDFEKKSARSSSRGGSKGGPMGGMKMDGMKMPAPSKATKSAAKSSKPNKSRSKPR